jgi:signal transduction histidine kinase
LLRTDRWIVAIRRLTVAMAHTDTIELFPYGQTDVRKDDIGPAKPTVILIRWAVVILCSYLILHRVDGTISSDLLNLLVALYMATNVVLYSIREELFHRPAFHSSLLALDTFVITISLIVNGKVDSEFFLTYFFLIIICCFFESSKTVAAISILAPLGYGALLFSSGSYDASALLRFPFLFVVSLFYGYFMQLVRTQKVLREQAEQKNKGKAELLNVLSHELKTPLTVITSYAQVLKEKMLGDVTAEQIAALGKIMQQSETLLEIMNAILDIASIETRAAEVRREDVALNVLFEDLESNYRGIGDTDQQLVWDYPATLPKMTTDAAKLKIILRNLINNALKFTDKGEIRVTVRHHPENNRVEISIKDTGIGIDKAQSGLIFHKFWQADAAKIKDHGGMGLGLYIVKEFCELLGGRVSVETELGQGSEFKVVLPAS